MSQDEIKIFVSYRRADAGAYAGWLSYCLEERYGRESVFRDVDSLEPGVPFMDAIEKWVRRSDVVLCLIGPHWSTVTDSAGKRRLDDERDPVRFEVATALKRKGKTTIPVLLQGAQMPVPTELPEDIRPITDLNGHPLSDARWRDDFSRLDAFLEKLLRQKVEKRRPKMRGREIVDRFDMNDEAPTAVGVAGGLRGKRMSDLLSENRWEGESFEVRFGEDAPGNPNWSSVDDFVRRVRS